MSSSGTKGEETVHNPVTILYKTWRDDLATAYNTKPAILETYMKRLKL